MRSQGEGKPAKTAYAAVWLDNYNEDFGVHKVFRERGKCLDFLVGTVFERAETLEVEVVDLEGKLEVRDGCTCYPLMTAAQVRDQLGSGMDFSLVMRYDHLMNPLDRVTVGIRETEVE